MERKMRLIAAAIFALTLVLTACQPQSATPVVQTQIVEKQVVETRVVTQEAPAKIKIGFIQRTMTAPYYVAMWDTMSKMAVEQGFELVALNSNLDTATHAKQVEDLISAKVDGVVINAVDPGTEKDVDQAIIDAGIPLVFIDTYVEGMDVVAIVRSDNYTIGKEAGKMFAKRFEGKPIKMLILQGSPTDVAVGPDREKGFRDGLAEAGADVEVVATGYAQYNQQQGLSVTEDNLVAHPEINAIFGYNDAMVLGALAALQAANRTDVLVAGIDGQKEAFAEIAKGCDAQYVSSGLNSPVLAAQQSVDLLLKATSGELPKSDWGKTVFTQAVGVDCSNIEDYYDPQSIF